MAIQIWGIPQKVGANPFGEKDWWIWWCLFGKLWKMKQLKKGIQKYTSKHVMYLKCTHVFICGSNSSFRNLVFLTWHWWFVQKSPCFWIGICTHLLWFFVFVAKKSRSSARSLDRSAACKPVCPTCMPCKLQTQLCKIIFFTLPETNSSHLQIGFPKRKLNKLIFQASNFQGLC